MNPLSQAEHSGVVQRSDAKPSLPDILLRYQAGELLQDLAREAGVHRFTLYRWIMQDVGREEYFALQTNALIDRIAEADDALDNAPARQSDVTRAVARCKLTRLDFERRRPHLYGPKQELQIDKQVHVHIHRSRGKPQDIDYAQAETVIPKAVDSEAIEEQGQ